MKLKLDMGLKRGVYRIFNKENGRSYVGSSVDMQERINTHRRALNDGLHHSPILQNAWNKYGTDCFVAEVLEVVCGDLISLRSREGYYITHYNAHKSKGGYNILLETEERCGWAEQQRSHANSYIVVSPEGKVHQVRFLSDFCEQHGLSKNSMYAVGIGKFSHHKYWRCWKSNNVPVKIPNLNDFVSNYDKMRYDMNRTKILTFNKSTRKVIDFVDPKGAVVECSIGIKNFSQKHDLSYHAMKKISSGKQLQHKGWSLYRPST